MEKNSSKGDEVSRKTGFAAGDRDTLEINGARSAPICPALNPTKYPAREGSKNYSDAESPWRQRRNH
ncbi:hypothetical protein V5799_003267 [Amblyomma americanum]|uniref:Uncharacterized protein n=1 Tax=Amblyomma americanum TaxID=6943 RepID=A0AAQ4D9G2_AMBAM